MPSPSQRYLPPWLKHCAQAILLAAFSDSHIANRMIEGMDIDGLPLSTYLGLPAQASWGLLAALVQVGGPNESLKPYAVVRHGAVAQAVNLWKMSLQACCQQESFSRATCLDSIVWPLAVIGRSLEMPQDDGGSDKLVACQFLTLIGWLKDIANIVVEFEHGDMVEGACHDQDGAYQHASLGQLARHVMWIAQDASGQP